MCPSRLCRQLKIPAFALALVLAGAALPFPGQAAYASPSVAKEPVAQPQFSECCHAPNPDLSAFFRSLKRAVARPDVAAMALLVEYPLRLNYADGGTTLLDNPRALETRFDETFPPDLRNALAHATEADVGSWVEDRVGFLHNALVAELTGNGNTRRYRVTDVYLPFTPFKPWQRTEHGLQFACETQKHWIIIDTVAGRPRYRAWNKPHFPPDEADMEISSGMSEGTSERWTFTQGDTTYTLGALSTCKGPADVQAKVTVAILGKTKRSWWCY
jgi:hypothetical protein